MSHPIYDIVCVIPDDKQIGVNGKFHRYTAPIPPLAIHLDPEKKGLHAIQWINGSGWVEWKNVTSEQITTEEEYHTHLDYYLDIWQESEDKEKAEEAQRAAEAEALFNSDEQRAERIRSNRNRFIADTDYYLLPDVWSTLTAEQQNELLIYRQALRDITSLEGFPWPDDLVPWPTIPTFMS